MKMASHIILLSLLAFGCNRTTKKALVKPNVSDAEVHRIPQKPSVKPSIEYKEVIKNETRFYTNLSSQFDFRLTVFNNDFNSKPTGSVLKIYTKSGEFLQKIEIANYLMFGLDLKEVYSFETKVNLPILTGSDNLYGTLVIEDFNFDGLYDIALMEGCAANGNARYHYYLQSEDSVFVKDKFLRKEILTYPAIRNVKRKQLTSANISFNSCRKTTVQYNDSLKQWKKIREVVYE